MLGITKRKTAAVMLRVVRENWMRMRSQTVRRVLYQRKVAGFFWKSGIRIHYPVWKMRLASAERVHSLISLL